MSRLSNGPYGAYYGGLAYGGYQMDLKKSTDHPSRGPAACTCAHAYACLYNYTCIYTYTCLHISIRVDI